MSIGYDNEFRQLYFCFLDFGSNAGDQDNRG
jgi:hypothetical protein